MRPAFTPVLPTPDPGLLLLSSALSFSPWPWRAGGPGSWQRNVLENGLSVAVRWDKLVPAWSYGSWKDLVGRKWAQETRNSPEHGTQRASEEVPLAKAAPGLVPDRAGGLEGWTRWTLDALAGVQGGSSPAARGFILEQLLRTPHYFCSCATSVPLQVELQTQSAGGSQTLRDQTQARVRSCTALLPPPCAVGWSGSIAASAQMGELRNQDFPVASWQVQPSPRTAGPRSTAEETH